MKNIGEGNGEFKAVGAARLSATAKYIATLMLATGARTPAELRSLSGLSKTTVYRVIGEIFASEIAPIFSTIPTCPDSPTIPADGNCSIPDSPADGNETEKTVPIVPPAGQVGLDASHAPADITTRATKELPSEVSLFEEVITPSSVPPKLKTKPSRGTRLPSGWTLPEDWLQWALLNFAHATEAMVRSEAEQFRDFWIAKAGQGATKLDWQATWRNWCRNSKSLARIANPKPFNSGRLAYDEAKAARVSRLREMIESRAAGAVQ